MRLVLLALLLLVPLTAEAQDMRVKRTDEGYLNLRDGPGTIHDILRRLAPGDTVSVEESVGKWAKVRLPSGERGWVSLDLLERASEGRGQVLFVNRTGAGYLNLRAAPGTDAKVLRRLYAGDRLLPLRREGKWIAVRDASGAEGWVWGQSVHR